MFSREPRDWNPLNRVPHRSSGSPPRGNVTGWTKRSCADAGQLQCLHLFCAFTRCNSHIRVDTVLIVCIFLDLVSGLRWYPKSMYCLRQTVERLTRYVLQHLRAYKRVNESIKERQTMCFLRKQAKNPLNYCVPYHPCLILTNLIRCRRALPLRYDRTSWNHGARHDHLAGSIYSPDTRNR